MLHPVRLFARPSVTYVRFLSKLEAIIIIIIIIIIILSFI